MTGLSPGKIRLVIAAALVAILSACGSRSHIPDQEQQAATAEAASTAQTAPSTDETNILYFAGEKTAVDDADKQKLRAHAARLKANPKLILTLLVHTDSRGSRAYNMAITEKWTGSVLRALNDLGVSRKRMRVRLASTYANPERARSIELLYK